jgi:hypothetical protein
MGRFSWFCKEFSLYHSGLDLESSLFIIDPCFRRNGVWIPAGVYPVLDTGRE